MRDAGCIECAVIFRLDGVFGDLVHFSACCGFSESAPFGRFIGVLK